MLHGTNLRWNSFHLIALRISWKDEVTDRHSLNIFPILLINELNSRIPMYQKHWNMHKIKMNCSFCLWFYCVERTLLRLFFTILIVI